jgi:hypothetical protein
MVDEVFLDQLFGSIGRHFAVNDGGHAGNKNLQRGLHVAQAHAAGLSDKYVPLKAIFLNLIHYGVKGLFGTGGNPTGSHSDNNLDILALHIPLFQILALSFPQRPQLVEGHLGHRFSP